MQMINSYGVALIDYNSGERTCRFLDDLLSKADMRPTCIVIVDNYQRDNDSYNDIKSKIKGKRNIDSKDHFQKKQIEGNYKGIDIELIKANGNLGYAKANNIAAKILQEKKCDSILFSNSDIVFPEDKFEISAFLSALDDHSDVLAVGSDVIDLNGNRQSPCKYLSLRDRWWRHRIGWPVLSRFYDGISDTIDDVNNAQYVYRVIGAFFFVNTEYFWKIKGFDENTFLYAEELILSERASSDGKKIYYIPGETVIHEDGITVNADRKKFNIKKERLRLKSDLYYYKKYKHVPDAEIQITKIIVGIFNFKRNLAEKIFHR